MLLSRLDDLVKSSLGFTLLATVFFWLAELGMPFYGYPLAEGDLAEFFGAIVDEGKFKFYWGSFFDSAYDLPVWDEFTCFWDFWVALDSFKLLEFVAVSYWPFLLACFDCMAGCWRVWDYWAGAFSVWRVDFDAWALSLFLLAGELNTIFLDSSITGCNWDSFWAASWRAFSFYSSNC